MAGKDNDVSKNFVPYEVEKSTLKKQKIKGNQRDSIGKNSDIGSRVKNGLSGHTFQAGLFVNELSSSLKEVRFSE